MNHIFNFIVIPIAVIGPIIRTHSLVPHYLRYISSLSPNNHLNNEIINNNNNNNNNNNINEPFLFSSTVVYFNSIILWVIYTSIHKFFIYWIQSWILLALTLFFTFTLLTHPSTFQQFAFKVKILVFNLIGYVVLAGYYIFASPTTNNFLSFEYVIGVLLTVFTGWFVVQEAYNIRLFFIQDTTTFNSNTTTSNSTDTTTSNSNTTTSPPPLEYSLIGGFIGFFACIYSGSINEPITFYSNGILILIFGIQIILHGRHRLKNTNLSNTKTTEFSSVVIDSTIQDGSQSDRSSVESFPGGALLSNMNESSKTNLLENHSHNNSINFETTESGIGIKNESGIGGIGTSVISSNYKSNITSVESRGGDNSSHQTSTIVVSTPITSSIPLTTTNDTISTKTTTTTTTNTNTNTNIPTTTTYTNTNIPTTTTNTNTNIPTTTTTTKSIPRSTRSKRSTTISKATTPSLPLTPPLTRSFMDYTSTLTSTTTSTIPSLSNPADLDSPRSVRSIPSARSTRSSRSSSTPLIPTTPSPRSGNYGQQPHIQHRVPKSLQNKVVL